MIETGSIDLLALDQREDRIEIVHGMARERQAQADPLTDGDAVTDAGQRSFECAVLASEVVVSRTDPVQADPDVAEARVFDPPRHLRRDPGAVRREGGSDAVCMS